MLDRLAGLEAEYDQVLARLADPAVLADQRALREASRRHKQLEPIIQAYRAYRQASEDLSTAKEMLTDSSGEDRDVVRDEIDAAESAMSRLEDELKVLL